MKEMLLFIQGRCPYCIKAQQYLKELLQENVEYHGVPIRIIDETIEVDLANSYDYYYVPTVYLDGHKVHEGIMNKETMNRVLQQATQ